MPPARATVSAVASPIPDAAPVTIVTVPEKSEVIMGRSNSVTDLNVVQKNARHKVASHQDRRVALNEMRNCAAPRRAPALTNRALLLLLLEAGASENQTLPTDRISRA